METARRELRARYPSQPLAAKAEKPPAGVINMVNTENFAKLELSRMTAKKATKAAKEAARLAVAA